MKIFYITLAMLLITFQSYCQLVREKNLTNHAGDDRYASYSSDGKYIVFESNRTGNWDIYMMHADGKEQRSLTDHDGDDRRPSWHPNGEKVLFESNRNGRNELYVLEMKGLAISRFTVKELDGEPVFARYSPDGKMIALSDKKSEQESTIKLVDLEGNLVNVLVDYGFRSFYPRWSSDGSHIIFFSRHETANEDDELYQINADGSGEIRLTDWPAHNFCPAWSPDNSRIAYVKSMDQIRPEIYCMNADGSGDKRITTNTDGDTLPDWSPEGNKLIITGYREGNFEIVELTIGGKP